MAFQLFQRSRCPFFGFQWPERSDTLTWVDRAECGLTFEKRETCRMEDEGRPASYYGCPVALPYAAMLEVARMHIRFRGPDPAVSVSLNDWMRSNPKHVF